MNSDILLRTQDDFNLVNQLLAKPRYNIPEHLRQKVIKNIEDVLDDIEVNDKLKLTAIRTLTALDRLNLDLVKIAIPKKIEHINPRKMEDGELLELVQEIVKGLDKQNALATGKIKDV